MEWKASTCIVRDVRSWENLRIEVEHLHVDPAAPGRLRYPTPVLAHRNYPGYTPGGRDRRWVNELELERSDVKWVGNMMYDTYPLTRFSRSGTDGFLFQGWWLNSSVPIPWNPGLDRPNYKTQILWSDQAVTSTHRCAGRIWAQSRHGSMNVSRRSSTEWAWATDGGGYVIALTRGSAPVRHSIIITPLFAGLSGQGIIFSENSHWRPLTRNPNIVAWLRFSFVFGHCRSSVYPIRFHKRQLG